jgi:hypothetical protein
MIEKISLRVFWTAMLLCAGLGLISIWSNDSIPEEILATFFIIGIASFLIWAPTMVYRFLEKKIAV